MDERKNPFLQQLRALMQSLLFPASPVLCCGSHVVVFVDNQAMLAPRSLKDSRPLAPDNSSSHWPAIMRANLAQSVFNVLQATSMPDELKKDSCCTAPLLSVPIQRMSLSGTHAHSTTPIVQ
jgi:hypothetical protein